MGFGESMVHGTVAWFDQANVQQCVEFDALDSESEFWKEAASTVFRQITCPDVGENPVLVAISAEGRGIAYVAMTARGTYDDGSGEKPSPFIVHEPPSVSLQRFASSRSCDYDDPAEAYGRLCLVGGGWQFEEEGSYNESYLAYASPHTVGGQGSYKFYRLVPDRAETKCQYGRIGQSAGYRGWGPTGERWTKPIPSWMYWMRYHEKLAKGYVDLTDAYLTGDEQDMLHVGITSKQVEWLAAAGVANLVELCDLTAEQLCEVKNIGPAKASSIQRKLERFGMSLAGVEGDAPQAPVNQVSAELYRTLMAFAKHQVEETFEAGVSGVTAAMVRKSREILKAMSDAADRKAMEEFNSLLLSLMLVCPRRASRVSDFLASSQADFQRILNREDGLIMSMEAVVTGKLPKRKAKDTGASFDDFGIDVRLATDDELDEIFELMRDPYSGEVARGVTRHGLKAWRVEPKSQRARFESYCKERNVSERKLLWHGSGKANWASIIQNSLQIRPTAAHGSMFGRCLYTSNRAEKSLGYCDGGYWQGGSGARFLGLYDTAYGNPMFVHDADHGLSYERVNAKGYDCVHALKGRALHNDEICFYDDSALCIKFLVEVG